MKRKFILRPETTLGNWSVALLTFFVIVTCASLILVLVLGVLNFDDNWWNMTLLVLILASIIAFITGLIAVIRNKDRSFFVFLSIFLGLCSILFIFLHSLWISD